jgi:HAD superfamily hydrolase (TIGR01509 family)
MTTSPASTSLARGVPAALPSAVVFDCDGTLADTESLSDRAWTETLARRGYTATPADFRAVIGRPFPQNWAYFAARHDLGDQATFRAELRDRFVALFDAELTLYADAVTTLRTLVEHDVPVAVASSSSREHVERVLERGALTGLVAAIVGADDVERHKPDPAPYLLACDALGATPTATAAVEDTPVGIAAATAAGLFTVGVVRAATSAAELDAADRVVHEVTVASLVRGT